MGKAVLLIVLSLLFGAGGAAIRYFELDRGFDALGLPITGNMYSMALIVLSAFFAVLSVAVVLWLGMGKVKQHPSARVKSGFFCCLTGIISAAALGYGAYLRWFACTAEAAEQYVPVALIDKLICGFMAAGAVALLIAVILFAAKGKLSGYLLILPVVAMCVLLVGVFREWCTDPVILHFAYRLLAIIVVMLAAYFYCAIGFGHSNAAFSLIVSMLGVFLGLVSLAESTALCDRVLFGFCVIFCITVITAQLRCVHGWQTAHDDDIIGK